MTIMTTGNNTGGCSPGVEVAQMIQTPTKNWWLLGLCGILDAIISVIVLRVYDAGPEVFSGRWVNAQDVLIRRLAVLAGICFIAAGIWKSTNGISGLAVLHGLTLSAYGF